MKRIISASAAVVVAVGLAGCGSGDSGSTATTGAAAASDAGDVFKTTPSSPPAPSAKQKKLGEQAGAGCYNDGRPCALEFAVTKIVSVPQSACSQYSRLAPDSRVVRVDLDAKANRKYDGDTEAPGHILRSGNWYGPRR